MKKRSLNEKRKTMIEFIKMNPTTTYREIRKKTRLHPERIFKKGLLEAFNEAGVNYPRKIDKRTKEEKVKQIIKTIKENPLITIDELNKITKANVYKLFKNTKEIYERANITPIKKGKKRKLKKQNEVINFIKNNSFPTQREINKNCKTHVQDLFEKGIFEAYEKAKEKFPYKRLKEYGIGLNKIRKRAKSFEEEISKKLSGYGKVNRLVKTKRGIADIVFERENKKIIIEIKDYQKKEISYSQIKQLNKYLEDYNCQNGILICHTKPKKDKFLIGKNKRIILTEEELKKIPEII